MRQSLNCGLCIAELQECNCKLQRTKTFSVSSHSVPTSAHTSAPAHDLVCLVQVYHA